MEVTKLLHKYHIHPDKSLGQNFLVDEAALQLVVAAAEISPNDSILEVGPGLGSLTHLLALSAAQVIAVELDPRLIPALREVVGHFSNVQIIQGDILTLDPAGLVSGSSFQVVANIPYYITSALLRHLLESSRPPRRMVLTVQQEVAKRICASPGDMSLLALSVQVYGKPVITACIPAAAFYPEPKVDSSILRIDILPSPQIPLDHIDTFFTLTKAGFSQKRKTIKNALSAGLRLPASEVQGLLSKAHIDPMRRAETLSIDEWQVLTDAYHPRPPA